jgi:hypothetical protein
MNAPKKDNTIDYLKLTDDELKVQMLNWLVDGQSFQHRFKKDYRVPLRCWRLLANDKEFAVDYNDLLMSHVQMAEVQLLTGDFLNDLPSTIDRDGNVDIARGHLRRAEITMKRLQWILEKRNKNYQSKSNLSDVLDADGMVNAIILPMKKDKESVDAPTK